MKSRIALLLSLMLIAGLVAAIQPASAGTWVSEVQFACTAKQTSAGAGLYYPTMDGDRTVTYTVSCGKGKPAKHVIAPSPGTPDFCQLSGTSVNGKKGTKLKGSTLPSNCNISASATAMGSCGLSTGAFTATITSKNGKSISVEGDWALAVGGNLRIIGESTTAGKPGTFVGDVEAEPDRTNKDESCAPSAGAPPVVPPNPTGANGFKVQGVATVTGEKAK